jgi:hypothetical protein
MPNLIPAAISSQLDQTGEERIHAAPYEVVLRPVYSGAPAAPAWWNPEETWWYDNGEPFQLIPGQLSNENKTFTAYDDGVNIVTYSYTRAVQSRTIGSDAGLRYFEIVASTFVGRTCYYGAISDTAPDQIEPYSTDAIMVDSVSFTAHVYGQNETNIVPDLVPGDVFGFLINLETGKVWVSINGVWIGAAPEVTTGWEGITLSDGIYRPFTQFQFDFDFDETNLSQSTLRLYEEEMQYMPEGASAWTDGVLPP